VTERPRLRTILRSIPLVLDMPVKFPSYFNGNNITHETPVYAAPAKFVQKQIQMGIYRPRKGFEYIPLGLTQRKDFLTTHYNFINGRWKQDLRRKGVTYLPVKLLPVKLDISSDGEPLDGSPFSVVTLQGLEHNLPFVLIEPESEEGLKIHGLYRTKTKRLEKWKKNTEEEEKWLEFIKSLKSGEYKSPRMEDLGSLVKTYSSNTNTAVTTKSAVSVPSNIDGKIDWLVPKLIHKALDEEIESQYQAKKTFAIQAQRYVRGIRNGDLIIRPVVLALGPTGTGKTSMTRHIGKRIGLPHVKVSLTLVSGTGYVDTTLSNHFKKFLKDGEGGAPLGIAQFDELDKMANGRRNTWGPTVQNELLGILDRDCSVELDLGEQKKQWFDGSNLFVYLTGAFVGLEEIIAKRLGFNNQIGFGRNHDKMTDSDKLALLKQVKIEDLIKYGIIPELAGRIKTFIVFNELTLENKINILKNPKMSPLEEHKKIFASMGYTLNIDEGVYKLMAEACPEATGARALESICGSMLEEIEYDPDAYKDGQIIKITPGLAQDLLSNIEIPQADAINNDNVDKDTSGALAG
jgi:ATP-dependent Clp protease ATP-binding subunit ClpX